MNAQKIGKLINELRTKKNLTQKDLADLVNVTDKAVSKWERGDGCPDISIMPNLANVLGINIENLMNGENPTKENSEKKIKPYNFARPTFLTKYKKHALWDAGEKFTDMIAEKIFAAVGEKFQFQIFSVDELSNFEFMRSIPDRTFIYNFDYNNGGICIELNPQIGKSFLKQDIARYQEPTMLDAKMLGEFFIPEISSALLEIFYDRTSKEIPFSEFELKNPETIMNPALIPYQYQNNVCGLISIKCKTETVEGFMNFQLSDKFIEKLFELKFFNAKGAEPVFQHLQNIKNKIESSNTFVEFGRFNPENVTLEKGRILVFDKKKTEGLNIVFNNKIIHTGQALAVGENYGVRILEDKLENEIVYDEAEYLSVQLGAQNIDEKSAAKLKAGSVMELDTITGMPSAIIKSGRTVAEGDIVIVNDNFGIRITKVF